MKWRLNTAAYINDRLWIEGTEIGDGTACPLPADFPPGPHMDPLDTAAKRARGIYDDQNPQATLDPWQKFDVPVPAEG